VRDGKRNRIVRVAVRRPWHLAFIREMFISFIRGIKHSLSPRPALVGFFDFN
jgi:hypothetical protein